MDALVTGAAGFIGSRLVESLAAHHRQVRGLARRSADSVAGAAEMHVGDLRDPGAVAKAIRGVDTVYHLAAATHGSGGVMRTINVDGTRILMEACLADRVRRVVLVSSVSVYRPPLAPVIDETATTGGLDIYGATKTEAEEIVIRVAGGKMEYVILRPVQVYGPADHSGYTRRLLRLLSSRYVPVARGSARFSLVHVDDVVRAIAAAGESRGAVGGVFNIAGPEQTSLEELALALPAARAGARRPVAVPRASLQAALGARWLVAAARSSSVRPFFRTYAAGTVHGSIWLGGPEYVTTRAREALGFVADIDPIAGIQRASGAPDDLASADD